MVEQLRTGAGWALRIAAELLERAATAVEVDEESVEEEGPPVPVPEPELDGEGPVEAGMWGVDVPEEALGMVAAPPPPPPPRPKLVPLPGSAAARLAAARGEE